MFSEKTAPMCMYCMRGTKMNGTDYTICKKKGVVYNAFHCRAYKYDALKRIPMRKPEINSEYTTEDFKL